MKNALPKADPQRIVEGIVAAHDSSPKNCEYYINMHDNLTQLNGAIAHTKMFATFPISLLHSTLFNVVIFQNTLLLSYCSLY